MPQESILTTPDSDRDDIYHVFQLTYAHIPRGRNENFLFRDFHDAPMPLHFNFWIAHNRHRTFLIDTGVNARAEKERNRPLLFDPIDALRRLGIDPDLIEDVFVSHLHYDHAGNLDRFAKARFHIQDAEVAFATGRCMCERHIRAPFDVDDVVTLVRHTFAERVVFHDGTDHPFPGVSVHAFPGHSGAVQGVLIETPRGPVLLAADATHTYANLARRSPFLVTVGVDTTLRSYTEMLRIATDVQFLIPGHDPLVCDFYPVREFNGLPLALLHEVPKPHDLDMLARLDG